MNDMNLLPEWYVRERMRNRADMFCVVLFGIVMAILMVDEYMGRRKLQQSRQRHDEIVATFDAAYKETTDFFKERVRRKQLLEDVKRNAGGQQYFTPLMLMDLLSRCAKPKTGVRFESCDMMTKWELPAVKQGAKTVKRGTKTANKPKPLAKRHVEVILVGSVSKEDELSRLDMQLKKTKLFSDVLIEQAGRIDRRSASATQGSTRSKFTMRLLVRPDEELIKELLQQRIIGEELDVEEEQRSMKKPGQSFRGRDNEKEAAK